MGLSHALKTYIESLFDEKKTFPDMNSVAQNVSPSFVEIKKLDTFLSPLKK